MSTELVLLAVLMGAVTYPTRAIALIAPGSERLPAPVLTYLRLVGPAVLSSLAAVGVMVATVEGRPAFHVGVEWVAVVVALSLTAWRRNLFIGLAAAVALVAIARAVGLA